MKNFSNFLSNLLKNGLLKNRPAKKNLYLVLFLTAGMIAIVLGWTYAGIVIICFTFMVISYIDKSKKNADQNINVKNSRKIGNTVNKDKKNDIKKPDDIVLEFMKNESPNLLLEYFDKIFNNNKIKDGDILLQYNKALILSYYGDFEKAESAMSSVDWEGKEPFIQSLDLLIKALINYLKPGDYEEGLRQAYANQKLASMSKKVPGGTQSIINCEIYIDIGNLLTESSQEDALKSLESKFDKVQYFPKALIAWCLAKVYLKQGLVEKANEKLNFCKEIVPHCKPLLNIEQ